MDSIATYPSFLYSNSITTAALASLFFFGVHISIKVYLHMIRFFRTIAINYLCHIS
ncbi:hypothetical protein BYT27DRAFT_6496822 [Phlegmacium glaucopus]|nr:hypothetical protein BYT27DRAFT_6496822 [Phlegmacium glaucopus]